MSKGDKPPSLPPPPLPTDPVISDPPPSPKCWIFNPTDATSITNILKQGDKAFGSFINSRVQVASEKGAVGYVPEPEAKEMIILADGSNKKLVGQVLSNEELLLIELCLI